MIAVQILRNYWLQITRLLVTKIPKTSNDSQKLRCSIENQIIWNSDFVGKKFEKPFKTEFFICRCMSVGDQCFYSNIKKSKNKKPNNIVNDTLCLTLPCMMLKNNQTSLLENIAMFTPQDF